MVYSSYQGEVCFSDSAVLEAAVGAAGRSFIQGNTKSPTGGEIQLMTEPGGQRRKMMRL